MAKKKTQNICESCRYFFDNWCEKIENCCDCPRNIPNNTFAKKCKCLLVKVGEPCSDYEKYTGGKENG